MKLLEKQKRLSKNLSQSRFNVDIFYDLLKFLIIKVI